MLKIIIMTIAQIIMSSKPSDFPISSIRKLTPTQQIISAGIMILNFSLYEYIRSLKTLFTYNANLSGKI
jgi:hypothetical protein